MQSLSSSFSLLVWTSEQMYSSILLYCSFSARCTMWIWILLSPSLPSLLYYYCNYKWVEWSNNHVAGESQIYSDSQFLVLRMYSFLASTGMGSSFAIGDWTLGCLPNQRFSGECPIHPPCLVLLHSFLTTFSLEVLMPSVLLISFWTIWPSLLHYFSCESSTSFLKSICRDSLIPGFCF